MREEKGKRRNKGFTVYGLRFTGTLATGHWSLVTLFFIFHFSFLNFLNAQTSLPARANVTPYYDDDAVEKQAYRESPYYMELTGSWQQRQTDSSVLYTRQLEPEKSWKDYLIFLNVRAGRAVRVLLNDDVTPMNATVEEFLILNVSEFTSNVSPTAACAATAASASSRGSSIFFIFGYVLEVYNLNLSAKIQFFLN